MQRQGAVSPICSVVLTELKNTDCICPTNGKTLYDLYLKHPNCAQMCFRDVDSSSIYNIFRYHWCTRIPRCNSSVNQVHSVAAL